MNFLAANLRILLKAKLPEKVAKNGWNANGKRWQKKSVDEANSDKNDKDYGGNRKRTCNETSSMEVDCTKDTKILNRNGDMTSLEKLKMEVDEKNQLFDLNGKTSQIEVARLDEKIEHLTSASTSMVEKFADVVAGKINNVAEKVLMVTDSVSRNSIDIVEMQAKLMKIQPEVDERIQKLEDQMVARSKVIYATLEAKQASQLKEAHTKLDEKQISRLYELKKHVDENLESLAHHFHNLLGKPEIDSDDG